jgi:hypothetical protein
MADPTDVNKGEGWLKKTWNLLVQTAVWISSFTAAILLPPTGVTVSEADPAGRVLKYTNFIIAVVVGLSLIATKAFNRRKHLWLWIILSLFFFGLSTYLIYKNFQVNNMLTCSCSGKTIVKGTTYKEPELIARFFPSGVDCNILCQHFVTPDGTIVPERVWTENSINDSRRTLFLSYVICFPAVALTIISVVQAIYCSGRRN